MSVSIQPARNVVKRFMLWNSLAIETVRGINTVHVSLSCTQCMCMMHDAHVLSFLLIRSTHLRFKTHSWLMELTTMLHTHTVIICAFEKQRFASIQHMRRRNPQENNNMAPSTDYTSVSQDPEDPSTKRGKSILPRSYNTRRRLSVLGICLLSGLALFATVRLFQNRESSKGKVIFLLTCHCLLFWQSVTLSARHETYFRLNFAPKIHFKLLPASQLSWISYIARYFVVKRHFLFDRSAMMAGSHAWWSFSHFSPSSHEWIGPTSTRQKAHKNDGNVTTASCSSVYCHCCFPSIHTRPLYSFEKEAAFSELQECTDEIWLPTIAAWATTARPLIRHAGIFPPFETKPLDSWPSPRSTRPFYIGLVCFI